MDYRNLNKCLLNTHSHIPRIEDLRASINGCQYFSKLDLNQAFFKFEICEDSQNLTVFYANGKLIQLNRLPQGVLPASIELNYALQQIFSHIPEVHVIHDDIFIATVTLQQHYEAIDKVLKTLSDNNLTLKCSKCLFAVQEIKPCPLKCQALQDMVHSRKKDEVTSFISLLQSHASFIPHFAKLTPNIRTLQKRIQSLNGQKYTKRNSTPSKITSEKQPHYHTLIQRNLHGFLEMQHRKALAPSLPKDQPLITQMLSHLLLAPLQLLRKDTHK